MKKALTDKQLAQQLERLKKVPWAEKAEALDHLLLVISRLLHGYLVVDENGRKHLAGGNTRFGAHSEREVGGETLYDYQTKVVEKLYDGSCRWMPQNTLAEQLEKIANSMIPKMVPVYKNQVKKEEEVGYCRKTVSLDVEWMGKEDDYTGDETDELKLVGNYKEYEEKLPEGQTSEIPTEGDNKRVANLEETAAKSTRDAQWKLLFAVADNDPDPNMERFLQGVNMGLSPKEMSQELGLTARQIDTIRKRLVRNAIRFVKLKQK